MISEDDQAVQADGETLIRQFEADVSRSDKGGRGLQ